MGWCRGDISLFFFLENDWRIWINFAISFSNSFFPKAFFPFWWWNLSQLRCVIELILLMILRNRGFLWWWMRFDRLHQNQQKIILFLSFLVQSMSFKLVQLKVVSNWIYFNLYIDDEKPIRWAANEDKDVSTTK